MTQLSISGFFIGTAEDIEGLTGVNVILAPRGAVAGVDVRGYAPGTRETDLLRPEKTVERIHSVVLAGGSAFGLEAACGVMTYLAEQGIGFDTGVGKVPIVCGAVLFDLAVGHSKAYPNKAMGYRAAMAATQHILSGNVGAGCGATVGKLAGSDRAMKGGTGYYELSLDNGLIVGAYVCVNSCGEVYDGDEVVAGVLNDERNGIVSSPQLLLDGATGQGGINTTIGCILTNADLTKTQCTAVSKTAHNGYALAIRPVHTTMDGDTIFTMALGEVVANVDTVCYLAQVAMRVAILDAVRSAETVGTILAACDLNTTK